MSDYGKRSLRKIFKNFYPEGLLSIRNEGNSSSETIKLLKRLIRQEIKRKQNVYRSRGSDIITVSKAIEKFLPGYSNLRIERLPRPHMLIDKLGKTFDLTQLSDGEKNLIALVGDIARRFTMANPERDKPLEGKGIILIDEIDLHLHPRWQRLVMPNLIKVFPKCQFFISTHSPQVISHVEPENIFILEQDKDVLSYRKTKETYGMSIERVVELIMDDEARPEKVKKKLDDLFELIERKKLNEAKKIIEKLKIDMSTDPDIMYAEMLIRQEEK